MPWTPQIHDYFEDDGSGFIKKNTTEYIFTPEPGGPGGSGGPGGFDSAVRFSINYKTPNAVLEMDQSVMTGLPDFEPVTAWSDTDFIARYDGTSYGHAVEFVIEEISSEQGGEAGQTQPSMLIGLSGHFSQTPNSYRQAITNGTFAFYSNGAFARGEDYYTNLPSIQGPAWNVGDKVGLVLVATSDYDLIGAWFLNGSLIGYGHGLNFPDHIGFYCTNDGESEARFRIVGLFADMSYAAAYQAVDIGVARGTIYEWPSLPAPVPPIPPRPTYASFDPASLMGGGMLSNLNRMLTGGIAASASNTNDGEDLVVAVEFTIVQLAGVMDIRPANGSGQNFYSTMHFKSDGSYMLNFGQLAPKDAGDYGYGPQPGVPPTAAWAEGTKIGLVFQINGSLAYYIDGVLQVSGAMQYYTSSPYAFLVDTAGGVVTAESEIANMTYGSTYKFTQYGQDLAAKDFPG